MAVETQVREIIFAPKDPPFQVVGPNFAANVASQEDGEEYIRRYDGKGNLKVYLTGEIPKPNGQ